MKLRSCLLILATFSSLLTEASILQPSISDAKSFFNPREWRRKKPEDKPLEQGEYPKYFHEPKGDAIAHHYDTRYSHGILSYEGKQKTQTHLIRSYVEFFQKNGMETWLAHGTLLGWWWNGHTLPWDWDIDTQISVPTLMYLAESYNSTIYKYTSATDTVVNAVTKEEELIAREYLLDINPAIHTRRRNKGRNVIDARWIDIRNGLYIDITGVAETHPKDSPGIWNCKNFHRYKAHDLWPMRETTYEGVTVKVPYAYEKVLGEEYGEKALVLQEYQGHKWSAADRMWVKKTPAEMKQRQSARIRKLEQKVEKMRLKQKAQRKKLQQEEQKEIQSFKHQDPKEQESTRSKESNENGKLDSGTEEELDQDIWDLDEEPT